MVELKYNGEEETFFIFDGKAYKTKDMVVEVENEKAVNFILTNPRWEAREKKKKTIRRKK